MLKDEWREGGRESERLVISNLHPNVGIKPITQACAMTRNQTHKLLVYRKMLQPTEPRGQG